MGTGAGSADPAARRPGPGATMVGMSTPQNLLGEPPPTLLPENDAARALLDGGSAAAAVVRAHPAYSLGWALLAEEALAAADTAPGNIGAAGGTDRDRAVEAYAYARVGYHRGLDALRGNGWKGFGPVPWEHPPNRGFLRALAALANAAAAIGEVEERDRCTTFLLESSPTAGRELGLGPG